MKNGYLAKQSFLFFFLLLFAKASIASDYALTFDTLAVNPFEEERYPFNMAESEKVITLTGLQPGDYYEIWVNAFNMGSECIYQVDAFSMMHGVSKTLSPVDQPPSTTGFEFIADASLMSFHISNNGCNSIENQNPILTLANRSCTTPPIGPPSETEMIVLSVDYNFTPTELIQDVFIGGGCFDVSNVAPIGNMAGIGHFATGSTSITLDEGVILASGNITNAPGPNTTESAGSILGGTGDPDLNSLGAGTIYDAVGIEFDFTPTVPTVDFTYVFASEEYCEWVNSSYNDVFGFFISGPGINGPFSNNAENIALVPSSGTYVGINTINHLLNSGYFIGNSSTCGQIANPNDIEYDGYTTVLTATANVIPCSTYHIRMVVSDVDDGIYDSAVFLGANSFNAGGDATAVIDLPGVEDGGVAYEGCADGFIVFERDPESDWSQDLIIDFEIDPSSTATNGVDYSTLSTPVTIPAGQGSVSIPLTIFQDGITEGIESLIIILDNACSCEGSLIELFIDDTSVFTLESEDQSFCSQASVTIGPTINGGIAPYTYQWSNGQTTPTITINQDFNESFYVTVTDDCGSTAEDIINVTVIPEPSAVISGDVTLCVQNPLGFLDISFTGTGPWEFYYTVDGNLFGPIVSDQSPYQLLIDEPGIYELFSVSDIIEGCDGNVSGTVIVEESVLLLTDLTFDVTCYGAADGGVIIIPAGGVDPYYFEWETGETTDVITNVGPGTYTITVTDGIGCTEEISALVFEPSEITAEATPIGEANCDDPQGGEVDLTVSGGSPGYFFEWSNGQTTEDLVGVPGGTYIVTITDIEGCTREETVTITENVEPPTAEATGAIITCLEMEVLISGSGNGTLSFEWLDPNGNFVANSESALVDMPGNYTLIVTNTDNGCTAEAMATVNEQMDLPTPAPEADGFLSCINEVVTLSGGNSSGNEPLTYQWFDTNGNPIGAGESVTVAQQGVYTLVVTDGVNGCIAEEAVVVDADNITPTSVIPPPDDLNCDVVTTLLDGSASSGNGGPFVLEWFDPSGSSLGNSISINADIPGTYTLVATNPLNGCTDQMSVTVSQDITPPPIDAAVEGMITCAETTATLTTSSGDNGNIIEWFDPSGGPLGSSNVIDVSETGSYTLIVTGALNGCTAEMTVDVAENVTTPTANAGADATITCDEETATLSGSGSSQSGNTLLEWYNSAGVLMGTGESIDVVETGSYTLVVTDLANGCTAEANVSVTPDDDIPEVEVIPPLALTCDNDISTLYGSSSTSGNIEFGWYDESGNLIANANEADVTTPGVYTFIVTNADNGCAAEASVVVTNNVDLPTPTADALGTITCIDQLVTLDGSTSTPIDLIDYEWLDPNGGAISIDPVVDVDLPGTYTLIITNTENGCTAAIPVSVSADLALPEASAVPDGALDCNATPVTLDGSGSSGSGTITYEWYDGTILLGTDPTLEVTTTGSYTLVVTDSNNGCTAEAQVAVAENMELPLAETIPPEPLTCIETSVTLQGNGSASSGNVLLEWLDANGTPLGSGNTIEANAAGTYTLVVTNEENGCTAETQISVTTEMEPPELDATVDGLITCDNQSVTLTGSTDVGTDLEWFDAGGTSLGNGANITVDQSGTFTLVATNAANGCTAEMPVTVPENLELPVANAGPAGLLTCDVVEALLDASGSSSGPNISYEWTNAGGVVVGNTTTIQVDQTGTYTLLVTNTDNGCTALATTTVDPDEELPIADAGPGAILTCDVLSVTIDGSASSSDPGITYQWLDPNGNPLGSDLSYEVTEPGIYTLVVSNTNNGCTAEASVEIGVDNLPPIADPGTAPLLDCANLTATLDGSGSTGVDTYQWLDANGNAISNGPTVDVEIAGTYELLVTAANGCTAIAEIIVEQDNEIPIADAGTGGNLDCNTTQVTIGGGNTSQGAGIVYEWLDAVGNVVATTPTFDATAPVSIP